MGYSDGIGEISSISRPLDLEKGEFAEWILLDAVSVQSCVMNGAVPLTISLFAKTPATCTNIALNNIYKDSIDLVVRVFLYFIGPW